MRKDLLALPWLTADQALVLLNSMLGYEIAYEDLISQCQYRHCEAYALLENVEGVSSTPLPTGDTDWTMTCYASGPQKVLNPEALTGSKRGVKLNLSGTVAVKEEDERRRYTSIEWEADVDLDSCAIRFQTSSIQELYELIASINKPLDGRERKSLHRIIAVLASMSGVNLGKPYAAHAAMETKAASLGILLGSDDTIAKHLEAVAKTVGR